MRKDVIQLLAQDFHDAVLNGIIKDEVVDSDRMLLADPMDSAYPLLYPHGVPREVVVDHQMSELQV